MRLVLFAILAFIGVWATACGGDGEPSPADTPTAAEGTTTAIATPGASPAATDIDIDATLLEPDDLTEEWQFQEVDECGATGPHSSLCPPGAVAHGKVAFATRGTGENVSAIVVVAEPGQAQAVAEAAVSRALTGERPWERETVDEPVAGTVRLTQELTDVSPPRVVRRLIFHQDPFVVDISLTVYEASQDLSVEELAALIDQRIARQLP